MKKKRIFWKIYGFSVLAVLLIIGAVWYLLYDFLKVYEEAQPFHKMDSVMAWFYDADADAILEYLADDYREEKKTEVAQSIRDTLADKALRYTPKYGMHSEDTPVYSICAENREICVVHLKPQAERARYDFKMWDLDYIEGLIHAVKPIEIVAPEGYLVTVNHEEIDSAFLVETAEDDRYAGHEEWDLIAQYKVEFPGTRTYRLEGLYLEPEIACYTPDGSVELEPVVDERNRTYRYDAVYFETIPENVAEDVREFARKYVKYVARDVVASEVLAYAIPDTLVYTRLKKIALMNEWAPKHSEIQFSDMEISEYQTFGDNAFSCKLHFVYTMPYAVGNAEYETDLSFFYLLVDGEWKIAEMVID